MTRPDLAQIRRGSKQKQNGEGKSLRCGKGMACIYGYASREEGNKVLERSVYLV